LLGTQKRKEKTIPTSSPQLASNMRSEKALHTTHGCPPSSRGAHHLSELADTLCMIMDSAVRIASDVPVIVTFLHR